MLGIARKQEVITFLLVVETLSTAHAQKNERCSRGGSTCPDQYTDTVDKDSLWDEWSTWSSCSVTCGTGVKVRSRACPVLDVGLQCEGPSHMEETCFLMACPNDKSGKPKTDDNDGDDAFTGESNEQGNRDHTNEDDGNHDNVRDDIIEDQFNDDGPDDNDGNYEQNDDDGVHDEESPHFDHKDNDNSPNTDSSPKSDDIESESTKDTVSEEPTPATNGEHDQPDEANDDTLGGDDLDADDPDDTTQEKTDDAKPSKGDQENASFGEDDDDRGQGEDDDNGQEDERDDGEDEREGRKARHTSTTSDQGERDAEDNEDASADDEPGGESGNDEDDEGDDDADDDDDKSGGKKKRKRPRQDEEEDEEEEDKDEEEEKEKKKKKRRKKKKKKRKRRKENRNVSENGDPVEITVVQEDTVILAEQTVLCEQGTTREIPRVVCTSSGLSSDPGQRESESPPDYSKSVSRSSSLYPVSQTSLDSTHSYLSQTGSYTSGDIETEDSSSSSWTTGDESDTSESYSSSSSEDFSHPSFSDSVFSSGLSSPMSMPGSPVDGPSPVTSGSLAGLFDLREQAVVLPPCRSYPAVSQGPMRTDIPESGTIMSQSSPDPAIFKLDSSSPQIPGSLPVSPISPVVFESASDLSMSISPASLDRSYVSENTKKRLQSTFIDGVDDEMCPENHSDTDISAILDTGGDGASAVPFSDTNSLPPINSSKYSLPGRSDEGIGRHCESSDLDCISAAERPVQ